MSRFSTHLGFPVAPEWFALDTDLTATAFSFAPLTAPLTSVVIFMPLACPNARRDRKGRRRPARESTLPSVTFVSRRRQNSGSETSIKTSVCGVQDGLAAPMDVRHRRLPLLSRSNETAQVGHAIKHRRLRDHAGEGQVLDVKSPVVYAANRRYRTPPQLHVPTRRTVLPPAALLDVSDAGLSNVGRYNGPVMTYTSLNRGCPSSAAEWVPFRRSFLVFVGDTTRARTNSSNSAQYPLLNAGSCESVRTTD